MIGTKLRYTIIYGANQWLVLRVLSEAGKSDGQRDRGGLWRPLHKWGPPSRSRFWLEKWIWSFDFPRANLSLNGLFEKFLCFIFSKVQKFHPFFTPCHENSGKYGSLLVAWRKCLDEHASGKSGLPSWLLLVAGGGGGFGCCCYILFLLSDDKTGTAFLIHVIVNQSQQLQKVQKKHRFCRPFLFVA